jgi:SAM-dependent methyltransferase
VKTSTHWFTIAARVHREIDELTLPLYFYYRRALSFWGRYAKENELHTILNVGTGMSPYSKFFNSSQLISLDMDHDCHPIIEANASQMSFKDSVFHGVICTSVIEHLDDPDAFVRECSRILSSKGILFLSVPFLFGEHGHDLRRWTRYGLKSWLESFGFQILDMRTWGGLFTVLAMTLTVSPQELFPPSVNRKNWAVRHNWPKYCIHLLSQIILTPLVYLIVVLDIFDRCRNFTCGYSVIASK